MAGDITALYHLGANPYLIRRVFRSRFPIWRRRSGSRSLSVSDEIDPRGVSGGQRERSVSGNKRRGEGLGKGEVRRIVGRDVVPQLPDPGEEQVVGIAAEREVGEVLECLQASFGVEISRGRVAAQNLSDFEVEKVGSVKRLASCEEALAHPRGRGRIEQDLEDCRGVDDDHLRSRSALIALAGGTRVTTEARRASRYLSSAKVGRSAARWTSLSR